MKLLLASRRYLAYIESTPATFRGRDATTWQPQISVEESQ